MREISLEGRLQRQISEIDARILALTAEKRALERMMLSLREGGLENEQAVRRNGAQRVLVEKAILDFLADGPATGSQILQHVRIVYRAINPSTLRSYIHRLDQRGLISKGAERGMWQLPSFR